MNTFIKDNWWKISILVILIIAIGGWFYWYGLRPAQIKHDCSWVKKHLDAITEITQEKYNACASRFSEETTPAVPNGLENSVRSFLIKEECGEPRSAQPAKDWYEPAPSAYYTFCIHEKGL